MHPYQPVCMSCVLIFRSPYLSMHAYKRKCIEHLDIKECMFGECSVMKHLQPHVAFFQAPPGSCKRRKAREGKG
jgi:hypothetical protein